MSAASDNINLSPSSIH